MKAIKFQHRYSRNALWMTALQSTPEEINTRGDRYRTALIDLLLCFSLSGLKCLGTGHFVQA